MLERDEAWALMCEWTPSKALRAHMRAVEVVMRAAAHAYGRGDEDVEGWGIAGLLHDADYEQWPQTHPDKIVAWLERAGEAEIAHAVSAHYSKWGVAHVTALDKALLACDELTGFVVACSLIRPDGITSLTPKSVKKRLKRKAFASGVERDEVALGMELLGAEPTAHIQLIIDALRQHTDELGLGAKESSASNSEKGS
jgi:predicted hydrolase (HD superfamily)